MSYSFLTKPSGELAPYMSLILEANDEKITMIRERMTIVQALASTGGIMGFVYIAVRILISGLQEFFFYQSIISHIFLHEKRPAKKY